MLTNPRDWPSDPEFAGVFRILSPQRLLPALQAQLARDSAGRGEDWNVCRAIEALYDPGQHVRVVYALSAGEVAAQRAWPAGELFYVRYPVRSPMSRRGFVMSVDGFDVEVYRFPNDRRLRGLRRFARRDRAAEAWQRWLDDDEPGLQLHPDSLRRGLLRYVPEQKWIIHLHARCEDIGVADQTKRAVAVRCADVQTCRAIYARTLDLRRVRKDFEGAFRIPKPLAIDEHLGLLVMRWVWGDGLLDLLRCSPADDIMDSVALGLRALQRMPIEGLQSVQVADYIGAGQRCAQDIGVVLPSLKRPLQSLLADLSRLRPQDDVGPGCTVHNDFHWKQLRGKPGRLTVLDFERCVLGDPWVDVATFATQLEVLSLRPELNVSKTEAQGWAQAFRGAWEAATSAGIDVDRVRWYGALALLTLARGMVRHLRCDWPGLATRFVDLAAAKLSSRQPEMVP